MPEETPPITPVLPSEPPKPIHPLQSLPSEDAMREHLDRLMQRQQ